MMTLLKYYQRQSSTTSWGQSMVLTHPKLTSDFCLGITDALDAVDKEGMLKFNVGIDSDHC
eukprot:2918428-Ditylum_brightwellii.AAC.1